MALASVTVLAIPSNASAQNLFTPGDYWLYNLSGNFGNAMFVGTLNQSYAGTTTIAASGKNYDVYDLVYDWSYDWSGAANGTTTIVEHEYVDIASEFTVVDEYNETFSLTNEWVYNKTTYLPPGGTGTWPSSIGTGDVWNITYTLAYEEMYFNGSSIASSSGTMSVVATYRVIGSRTVTVPAGTFDCILITESTSDSTYTRYYSTTVGNDAQAYSQQAYGSGGTDSQTLELQSFSYGGSKAPSASSLYVGVGAAVTVLVVVIVLLLYLNRRRRQRMSMSLLSSPTKPEQPPSS